MKIPVPDRTSASIQALAPVCIIQAECIRTDFLSDFQELRTSEVPRAPFPDVGRLCVMVPIFMENWLRFSARLDDVTQTVRFELVDAS